MMEFFLEICKRGIINTVNYELGEILNAALIALEHGIKIFYIKVISSKKVQRNICQIKDSTTHGINGQLN